MKRRRVMVIGALALLGVLLALMVLMPAPDPANAPRFVKMDKQPAGTFQWQEYDWGGAVPFHGGKMWVMTTLGTNHPYLLYDLEKRRVEGEMLNGSAIFFSADLTKVFCEGPPTAVTSWKTRVLEKLSKLLPGKFGISTNRVEAFWILDLRNNRAQRVGNLSQVPGTGSRWLPAPGFRYAYTHPTTLEWGKEFIVCDLEAAVMQKVSLDGQLLGWWDEKSILVKDPENDFILWSIATKKTMPLFTREQVRAVLKEHGLEEYSAPLSAFTSWNGKGYDVYFFFGTAPGHNPDKGETFLLKANPATKTLRLHAREFRFGYLGKFNEAGTLYAWNGESGASGRGGNGAVRLLDMRDGTEREAVPANNAGQYALPRLYGNSIIFRRNQLLWRQEADSTNAVRLIPDAE